MIQTVDKPHSSVVQNGVCAFQDIKNRILKTENGCLVLLRLSTMTISFPYCQLFQIHGSKFKLHPVCYLSETSVVGVSHLMLFFCICEYTLYFLLAYPAQLFVSGCVSSILGKLYPVLPDMPSYCFFRTWHSPYFTSIGSPQFIIPTYNPKRPPFGDLFGQVFQGSSVLLDFTGSSGRNC